MKLILTILVLQGVVAFGQTKADVTICSSRIDSVTHEEVYWPVDKSPTVQGGLAAISKEVSKRIKYPHLDHVEKYPIETSVIVAFVVTEEGQIKGQRITRNAGTNLAEQLLDILDDFTWEPGQCNGKAVSSLYVFPLIIDLQR